MVRRQLKADIDRGLDKAASCQDRAHALPEEIFPMFSVREVPSRIVLIVAEKRTCAARKRMSAKGQ
jgi:uncharacterized small protein (DUF1192 family)